MSLGFGCSICVPDIPAYPVHTHPIQDNCPLAAAAQEGHLACVRLLVELGADVNAQRNGSTALYNAVGKKHASVVRALIAFGANPNTEVAKLGQLCPLFLAALSDAPQCMRELIRGGADVNHAFVV